MTATTTCPPWCTDHDDQGDPGRDEPGRYVWHRTRKRSVDVLPASISTDEPAAAWLAQFAAYGFADPADDEAEPVAVTVELGGCEAALTPANARQLAAALVELAALAEQP